MSGPLDATHMNRRRMVVASGAAIAAPLALAACGTTSEKDARSGSNDPDLLNAVLAHHLAVLDAAGALKDAAEPALDAAGVIAAARDDSVAELEAFIGESGGEATTEPAETAQAESQVEGLALQLEDSIEASLEVIGDVSDAAYRQSVHRFITEDAAALAALHSVTGDEIVPDAFVFGPPTVAEDSE